MSAAEVAVIALAFLFPPLIMHLVYRETRTREDGAAVARTWRWPLAVMYIASPAIGVVVLGSIFGWWPRPVAFGRFIGSTFGILFTISSVYSTLVMVRGRPKRKTDAQRRMNNAMLVLFFIVTVVFISVALLNEQHPGRDLRSRHALHAHLLPDRRGVLREPLRVLRSRDQARRDAGCDHRRARTGVRRRPAADGSIAAGAGAAHGWRRCCWCRRRWRCPGSPVRSRAASTTCGSAASSRRWKPSSTCSGRCSPRPAKRPSSSRPSAALPRSSARRSRIRLDDDPLARRGDQRGRGDAIRSAGAVRGERRSRGAAAAERGPADAAVAGRRVRLPARNDAPAAEAAGAGARRPGVSGSRPVDRS